MPTIVFDEPVTFDIKIHVTPNPTTGAALIAVTEATGAPLVTIPEGWDHTADPWVVELRRHIQRPILGRPT